MRVSARILSPMSTTPAQSTAPRAPPPMAPGPRGRFLLGSLPEIQKDPLKLFVEVAREHGDVVRLKLAQPMHLVNHPDHIKHVLQDNHLNYEKGFGYARMEPLVGTGLLT